MSDERLVERDAVLIVGAGLAGLFLALKLAPRRALVLSPAPLGEGAASAWAQGGLAAAFSPNDSPAAHARDTIAAGAGLVDPVVAHLIAEAGPARVRDLLALGVPFDRTADGALRQSLEAAHMDALIAAAGAATNIRVIEGYAARALLQDGEGRARGVLARDAQGRAAIFEAGDVVFATGGLGGLWRVTTNPPFAVGHGLAIAARAGALIGDPEFMQFHPTAIDIGRDPAPLATEALRGEGATLIDTAGAPFMKRYDAAGDLAPRDVVARAIHQQLRDKQGAFLDARTAIGEHFPDAFPTVFAACMSANLDPRTTPIPVAPAAHYHMGGIVTDLWGQTSVERLSAVGECASTGAHGANRLASNSLLESVVFADRIAERLRGDAPTSNAAVREAALPPELSPAGLTRLRALMGDHLGVLRAPSDREAARTGARALIAREGLTNELLAAALVAEGAARRLESRGAHYCTDHPLPAPQPVRTFLTSADLALTASVAALP